MRLLRHSLASVNDCHGQFPLPRAALLEEPGDEPAGLSKSREPTSKPQSGLGTDLTMTTIAEQRKQNKCGVYNPLCAHCCGKFVRNHSLGN